MRAKSIVLPVGFAAAVACSAAAPRAPSLLASQAAAPARAALDDRVVTSFLRDLRRAVAGDDRAAVAGLVRYPLMVSVGAVRIPIADAAAMREHYDIVFSPAVKDALAQAAVPGARQPAPRFPLTIAATTATIGDVIRIERDGDRLAVTGITPPQSASAAPDAVQPGRAAAAGRRRSPQRLGLDVGRTQRAGTLGSGERDTYLVTATKNQLVEVRINGVNGRDVVARIVNPRTGAPIDARAGDGVRTWTGRMPETGEYRVDVVRLAPGSAPLAYVIVVSLQ
jgi:hypothetical protein